MEFHTPETQDMAKRRRDAFEQRIAGFQQTAREGYYFPRPAVMRAAAIGYNELVADLLWIRTIIYFTDHFMADNDLRYLERHMQNIVTLDPHFKQVYRFGASMLTNKGSAYSNEDTFAAIRLLKRAHELFPDDPNYPLYIGIYYMNELRTKSRKQRNTWRRQGADWIRRAILLGDSREWLPALAANIYTQQGERELAIEHLKEMYVNAPTEKMRIQISAKLKELQATYLAVKLKKQTEEFDNERKASGLSFVPADLFAIIRQPKLSPLRLSSRPAVRGKRTTTTTPVGN